MEPVRSLLSALNQLVTTTGLVWWRCLPRLLVTVMLGWLGYHIFAQWAALVVDVSAWWSLLLLSIGFVVRLSAIIIGLRIAGEEQQIRAAIPLPDDDPRDNSISHLLSITLLPFLGIYAVFDVITDAANHVQIDYYVFRGLTFEQQVLSQFNPQGAGVWLIVGVIVGLYVVRRLVEAWFERTGFRPLGLVTDLIGGLLHHGRAAQRPAGFGARAALDRRPHLFGSGFDWPRLGVAAGVRVGGGRHLDVLDQLLGSAVV